MRLYVRATDVEINNDLYIKVEDVNRAPGEWEAVNMYFCESDEYKDRARKDMSRVLSDTISGFIVKDNCNYYRAVETMIADSKGGIVDAHLFADTSVFKGANFYDISFSDVDVDNINDAWQFIDEDNFSNEENVYITVNTKAFNVEKCRYENTDIELNFEREPVGEILEDIQDAISN